jgi:hypothetical protein
MKESVERVVWTVLGGGRASLEVVPLDKPDLDEAFAYTKSRYCVTFDADIHKVAVCRGPFLTSPLGANIW